MSSEDILKLAPPPADARLPYGKDSNQFGELRLPKSEAKGKKSSAVVMNIHGGFWRSKYNLAHAGHLCGALTAKGLATWNIEYRRVGNPGGGWPGTFEDIANGLKYIQQHAAEHHLDTKRIVVIGHSAGGQLAVCLAHRAPEIRGVVSLAGVLDLKRAY